MTVKCWQVMSYPLFGFSGSPAPGVAPKGFFTADPDGVFRALRLAPSPAASEAAPTGTLPPAFPGVRSEALTAARAGARQTPVRAALPVAIEAALEVRYPVRVLPREQSAALPVPLSIPQSAIRNLRSSLFSSCLCGCLLRAGDTRTTAVETGRRAGDTTRVSEDRKPVMSPCRHVGSCPCLRLIVGRFPALGALGVWSCPLRSPHPRSLCAFVVSSLSAPQSRGRAEARPLGCSLLSASAG